MRICRAALAVAFRHPVYLLVYTVFLSCMGVFLTMGVTSDAAEDTVFEPARARIAVVDRDGSPVAAALERYLGTRSDLVPLADDAFALQDALAQSRVEAVVIVPAGYGDDLLAAARDGAAPADGASAGTASVDGMSTELPSVQIAYGTYNEASALVEEEAGRFCSLVAASAALDPTALVDEVLSRAETAAVERAVTTVTATEATSSAADPLIAYLSFSAYTIACSVVVCAGLVLSRFGAPDIRRRTAASPARPARMSAELLLAGVVIVVGVWAVSGAVGVASSGALAASVAPTQVVLALAIMLAFSCVPLALAFMLAQLGLGEEMLNAVGNIAGLLMSFLGGAWVPLSLLGDGVQAVAHFVPTYWTNTAVAAVLSAPALTADVLVQAAQGAGVTLLFAVAFAVIGIGAARMRLRAA